MRTIKNKGAPVKKCAILLKKGRVLAIDTGVSEAV